VCVCVWWGSVWVKVNKQYCFAQTNAGVRLEAPEGVVLPSAQCGGFPLRHAGGTWRPSASSHEYGEMQQGLTTKEPTAKAGVGVVVLSGGGGGGRQCPAVR